MKKKNVYALKEGKNFKVSTATLAVDKKKVTEAMSLYWCAIIRHADVRDTYITYGEYAGDCLLQEAWRYEEEGDATIASAFSINGKHVHLPYQYLDKVCRKAYSLVKASYGGGVVAC